MNPAPWLGIVLAAGLGLPWSGCASQPPPPPSEANQAVEAARAEAAREAAEQEAGGEPRRRSRRDERRSDGPEPVREKIVVISAGGSARTPTAAELAEATRAERDLHGDRSVGELTDENLAELAARGKVTYAGGAAGGGQAAGSEGATGGMAKGEASGAEEDGAEAGAAGAQVATASTTDAVGTAGAADSAEACGETCWRRRAYDLRRSWSETVEEIALLEEDAADLRWRFYAEDDPWVRDSQIKPAWDRTLDRLRQARDEADLYQSRVDDLMDEGRRSGALPGWLREGIELEPRSGAEDRRPGLEPAEPVEPTVATEDARQPTDDGY